MTEKNSRKALIVGVANDHSIAWGIAQALSQRGYDLAFTYQGEALERRVKPLAESVGAKDFVFPMDVKNPEAVQKVVSALKERWGGIHALLHCVAFAERKDLDGKFIDTSREGFLAALEVSTYSLVSLTRECKPLLCTEKDAGGSAVLTLSYYGAEKVIPNYNVMGVAKAALEATVRYMAADLGPENIRVNALSAGPVRTLAAAGIQGFRGMMKVVEEKAPLRRNVGLDEVGSVGAFLLDKDSSCITGETLYADSGYHILGM